MSRAQSTTAEIEARTLGGRVPGASFELQTRPGPSCCLDLCGWLRLDEFQESRVDFFSMRPEQPVRSSFDLDVLGLRERRVEGAPR